MKMTTECMECLLRKNVAMARELGTEGQAMAFAKDMMRAFLDAPDWVSAPYFAPFTSAPDTALAASGGSELLQDRKCNASSGIFFFIHSILCQSSGTMVA